MRKESPIGALDGPAVRAAGRAAPSAWRRWTAAVALAVLVAGLCYLAGQVLTRRWRDWTPAEIRNRMTEGTAALPLEEAIEQVNRLEVRARREVMRSAEAQGYFERLKPEDRFRFVRQTLDRGIQDQIERFRRLKKEERGAFVEEARARQREARAAMDGASPEEKERLRAMVQATDMDEVIQRAMRAYLSLTTSEERADLAPLFDGALDNLQHARSLR